MQITSAHVLVSTAVASLSRRHTVSLRSEVHTEARCDILLPLHAGLVPSLYLFTRFIEVLGRVVRRAEGRTVKVVKHQVHVFSLLILQVVANLYVAMNFYFYMCVGLAR